MLQLIGSIVDIRIYFNRRFSVYILTYNIKIYNGASKTLNKEIVKHSILYKLI